MEIGIAEVLIGIYLLGFATFLTMITVGFSRNGMKGFWTIVVISLIWPIWLGYYLVDLTKNRSK